MSRRSITILILLLAVPVFPRAIAAEDRPAEKKTPGRASRGGAVGSGNRSPGDSGTVQLFGIAATGHKFVYVVDRSGSMGGDGRRALAAAKKELLASLDGLENTQQLPLVVDVLSRRTW
jgi:hypothetical protein